MIGSAGAQEIAARYLREMPGEPGGMHQPWRVADAVGPLLVRTTDLDPSFWIVPVQAGGFVLGYVCVGLEGEPRGHAYLYERPDRLEDCPQVVTRITADAARRAATGHLADRPWITVGGAVFVHDGPPNRLAWMVEAWDGESLVAHVFVTPDHLYERAVEDRPRPPQYRGG